MNKRLKLANQSVNDRGKLPQGLVGAAWLGFWRIYLIRKDIFKELKKKIIHTYTSILGDRAKPEAKSGKSKTTKINTRKMAWPLWWSCNFIGARGEGGQAKEEPQRRVKWLKKNGASTRQSFIAELAERSRIIIQNSSNPWRRKNLDVRPYDRTRCYC